MDRLVFFFFFSSLRFEGGGEAYSDAPLWRLSRTGGRVSLSSSESSEDHAEEEDLFSSS